MKTPSEDRLFLPPSLILIVHEVLSLRSLSKANGMSTRKTQNQILEQLAPSDLALVAHALELAERQGAKR
jgi:hypothetical protein